MPVSAVPDRMGWGVAWLLFRELLRDTTSHACAAVAGWSHPMSRDAMVLADLVDLYVHAHARKGAPADLYPRPWPDPNKQRLGRPTRPQHEIRAALAAMGRGGGDGG